MNVLIVFWTGMVVFSIIEIYKGKEFGLSTYIWLAVGMLYVIIYSFTIYKQYVTIQDNWLYRNELPFKKIDLTQLREVKKFAGDYTLKTDQTELVINTQIMGEQSRQTFEAIMEEKQLKAPS